MCELARFCLAVLFVCSAARVFTANRSPRRMPTACNRPVGILRLWRNGDDQARLGYKNACGRPILTMTACTDIAVVNNTDSRIEILLQKPAVSSEDGKAHLADANDIDINELNPPSKFRKIACAGFGKTGQSCLRRSEFRRPCRSGLLRRAAGLVYSFAKTRRMPTKKKIALSWKPLKKIKIDDGLLNSNSLECADINNDGKADLILAGTDAVYVIFQQADGTLAEPIKYPTTSRILAMRIADFNGDKQNDLLMITNDTEKPLSIRFGQAERPAWA